MRGHWQTSGLRKLNRHYQSAGGGAGGGGAGVPRNVKKGCVRKLTKGGVDYFPAPSYCWVQNGAMVLDLPYSGHSFNQLITGIEYAKIENIELVPYIPKTSDNYYVGNVTNVFFTADGDAELYIDDGAYGPEGNRRDVIMSWHDGDDISTGTGNFIKCKYVAYIVRKDGFRRFYSESQDILNAIYQAEGIARIHGKPEYTGLGRVGYQGRFVGTFTASNNPGVAGQALLTCCYMMTNGNYRSASANTQSFRYPAMTLCEQYFNMKYWNGEQKVEEIQALSLSPYMISGGSMCGFDPDVEASHELYSFWDPSYNKTYSCVFVLKELEGVTCHVTG